MLAVMGLMQQVHEALPVGRYAFRTEPWSCTALRRVRSLLNAICPAVRHGIALRGLDSTAAFGGSWANPFNRHAGPVPGFS